MDGTPRSAGFRRTGFDPLRDTVARKPKLARMKGAVGHLWSGFSADRATGGLWRTKAEEGVGLMGFQAKAYESVRVPAKTPAMAFAGPAVPGGPAHISRQVLDRRSILVSQGAQ